MFNLFWKWLSNGTYSAVMSGFSRAVTELTEGDESQALAELRAKLTAATTPALPPAADEAEPVKARRK